MREEEEETLIVSTSQEQQQRESKKECNMEGEGKTSNNKRLKTCSAMHTG